MTFDQAISVLREAMIVTLVISGPILLVGLVIGLVISIFQAVTQIQDQTLSFVPKIILMLITALLLLPWSINLIVEYSENLYRDIPGMF